MGTAIQGTGVQTEHVNPLIVRRGKVCNNAQWDLLLKPVTKMEIKDAIFSIPEHKAPRPKGFSSAFYKDSWSIRGDEVCEAVLDFFKTGKLLKQVNSTILTLIHKCTMPTHVTQFRPIACCNVLYKCISKILCTRLAGVLPDIISLNQGRFIKGRSIIENILVCQDLVRLYNRQACTPRCMFKMDLMKAYDSVSWQFVEEILDAFHFPLKFSKLVLECVRSASFSLAVNGETFGFFPGKRGLRQGDPMSPLLFTLCMEYLSRIILCATEKMKFSYHPLCKQIKLTHLMFADDLLLFCKGDAASIMVLLRAYSSFSAASGLKVNAQNSNAYFNGVGSRLKEEILSVSRFMEAMFVLPKGVMDRVNVICRNYLWERSTEFSKAPRVAWAKVCVPKKEGGLGLKQSENWNAALIGKLVWWIVVKQNKLWVQWFHHVYLKGSPWLSYTPPPDASWYWRKICKVKDLIQDGFDDGIWSVRPAGYSVKSCYNWLRDKNDEVWWCKPVWSSLGAPKHAFIAWLVVQNALMLKVSLFQFQVSADKLCCICQLQDEDHEHLFQTCTYSTQILQGVGIWLCSDIAQPNGLLRITRCRWRRQRKGICTTALLACWYHIWMQRNQARLNQCIVRPAVIIADIQKAIRSRYMFHKPCNMSSKDRAWLSSVQL
ncbi:uncharacterized protein LOC141620421 [Silene latifolia]|uniref:uncharacterized protein LOC141620421 n=1 Tax=Silene latifolia TaxID=37657 RepID=UPI003D7874F6